MGKTTSTDSLLSAQLLYMTYAFAIFLGLGILFLCPHAPNRPTAVWDGGQWLKESGFGVIFFLDPVNRILMVNAWIVTYSNYLWPNYLLIISSWIVEVVCFPVGCRGTTALSSVATSRPMSMCPWVGPAELELPYSIPLFGLRNDLQWP